MTEHEDATAPPREGEALDVARLRPVLEEALGPLGEVVIEQFPSGHSNLTYLLRAGDGPDAHELVLRRPPFGAHAKGGHDMAREFRILDKVSAVYPQAPRPVVLCEDEAVMGATFYVMERIRGVILRADVPAGLPSDPETMRRLSESFVDNLVTIHTLDYEAAGLGDVGRPDGYVERQIRGWTGRWRDSWTDDIPEIDAVAAWLAENLPPEAGAGLIHNDYKYDNIVLDPDDLTRIVGVLDWEMATVGDPLMDFGSSLGYWVEAGDSPALQAGRFGPTTMPGSMTRRELVDRYAAATGLDVSGIGFYYAYALWKLAIILQQIYYRYAKGFTTDERFAAFIHMVRMLGQSAAEVIEHPERV